MGAGAIRLLRASDIPAAMRLKETAGWNQTGHDWKRLLALEPEGCFLLEQDEAVVATATALTYGTDLAWIGMVLTLPEFRGRGFARLLTTRAMEFAETRASTLGLDASHMGIALYRSLGFEAAGMVERWERPPQPDPSRDPDLTRDRDPTRDPDPSRDREGASHAQRRRPPKAIKNRAALQPARAPRALHSPNPQIHSPLPSTIPDPLFFGGVWQPAPHLDRAAFGADRGPLLESLAEWESASIKGQGYVMGRPGSHAAYFGPCVARSAETAKCLLRWYVARHPAEPIYWDILAANLESRQLAAAYGFRPVRQLTRMFRGRPPHVDQRLVFAIAGLEYG